MIIQNNLSRALFLGYIGKNGRWIPAFPGTIEVDDRVSQIKEFKEDRDSGRVTPIGFNSDSLDFVVQDEVGAGGSGADVFAATVVVGNAAAGDTINDANILNDIQGAINSISSGSVYIKRGTYTIASKIILKDNVKIVGDGAATVLVKSPSVDGFFDFNGRLNVDISSMRFTSTLTSTSGTSFMFVDGSNIKIHNNIFDTSAPLEGTLVNYIDLFSPFNEVSSNRFDGASVLSTGVLISSDNCDVKDNRFDGFVDAIVDNGNLNNISHNRISFFAGGGGGV